MRCGLLVFDKHFGLTVQEQKQLISVCVMMPWYFAVRIHHLNAHLYLLALHQGCDTTRRTWQFDPLPRTRIILVSIVVRHYVLNDV
jgi:hypothetical protein